jgi:protein-disulfide isomerase
METNPVLPQDTVTTQVETPLAGDLLSVNLTPSEKHSRYSVPVPILLISSFIIGLVAGFLIWGLQADKYRQQAASAEAALATAVKSAADATPAAANQKANRYKIPVEGAPSTGPENAAITIVEFSDYQCPYCTKWHQEVYHQLMETYKGKIRFIYKDFPLFSIHENAIPAAEAAYCAGEQNKYWEYHDRLFSGNAQLNLATFQQYGIDVSLDMDKFNTCLTNRTYQKEVEDNYQWAANLGIQSTPTFFINGLAMVGALPYASFKQVIDDELAGNNPQ